MSKLNAQLLNLQIINYLIGLCAMPKQTFRKLAFYFLALAKHHHYHQEQEEEQLQKQ